MTIRMKIAFNIYVIIAIGTLIAGSIYIFSPQFMPYHSEAIGLKWEQLDRPFQILLLALVKATGAGQIATGLTILILLVPFRRGERWARLALPALGLSLYVPLLYVTLMVKLNTPASPPWYLALLCSVLFVVGAALSLHPGGKRGAGQSCHNAIQR